MFMAETLATARHVAAGQNWGVDYLAGSLLVAMPDLTDPNFARSVVLVLEHDDAGAVGVVLNRPTEISPSDELPEWVPLLATPDVVFLGGPVDPDAAVGLSGAPEDDDVSGVQLVDLTAEPGELTGPIRVFAGYAGWGPQQLEMELAQGGWLIAGAEREDVFTDDPSDLWRRVISRQPGRVSMYANFPLDPRAN